MLVRRRKEMVRSAVVFLCIATMFYIGLSIAGIIDALVR